MKRNTLFVFLLLLSACKYKHVDKHIDNESQKLKSYKIAFGSCSHQDQPQPLWDEVVSESADIWIWLGDNIYGDSENMDTLRAKYLRQKLNPEYQVLMKQTKIIGTWDDHDFGENNAGKNYPAKEASQQELLDFLDVPMDDERRRRAGVYTSYDLGDSAFQIKILLLDTRYFRDDLKMLNDSIVADSVGTILGDAQWVWLESVLAQSTADVHLFASGIQFLPEEHIYEKWANFPKDREKLLQLIHQYQINRPIVLSGDRHIGEISRLDYQGQLVYDLTSSSLTHGWSEHRKEPNKHRIGNIVYDMNYGVLEISSDGIISGYLKSHDQSILEKTVLTF
ncbi:alkaline phosphatase family protein [Reichenbachiella agarivorans]|uniref:Alkaline phosphatase family protein n=1 Tax=Reichenbachiella agarivorans TaxID=2979464 RepID=A0ABY6CP09_9BACT|nr:alkaline phosphatase D family protein [Reichenbachiella agarivorans]UXP32274.1 alkaline phosphatase family protein [Reichenbachiella agarivorans]